MSFCSTRAVEPQPPSLMTGPHVSSVALLTNSSGCMAIRKGRAHSRVPASRNTSFSAVAPAARPPAIGGPCSRPCHSSFGLVAPRGPTSQCCYEYKPLINLNPARSSSATATAAVACIDVRRRQRRGVHACVSAHPGIRPRAAECISAGYWPSLSPGGRKNIQTAPQELSEASQPPKLA